MGDPILQVDVWRGGAEGAFRRYEVPRQYSQTVPDVVTWIQRRLDPTLAYRFACRVGMCGTCAMTVNGKARWSCRTHVARVAHDNRLVIAPLAKLPHVMFFGGGVPIKLGDEVIGAIGAAGAPGAKLDDGCARAGLAKISDRLK